MLKNLALVFFVIFQVQAAYATVPAQPSPQCDSSEYNTRCIFKPGCYEVTDYYSCLKIAKKCVWDDVNNYCKPSN